MVEKDSRWSLVVSQKMKGLKDCFTTEGTEVGLINLNEKLRVVSQMILKPKPLSLEFFLLMSIINFVLN